MALHSQTTRLVEGATSGGGPPAGTGLSPSAASGSRELAPGPPPKRPLQITTRAPGEPDFKFGLGPLHSPLLGPSLLVSFPPLIDMLKFGGYPCLIRGRSTGGAGGGWGRASSRARTDGSHRYVGSRPPPPTDCGRSPAYGRGQQRPRPGAWAGEPDRDARGLFVPTLEQACLPGCREAQCAFKDSMIH